ncbi:MAG: ABC transporter permease [Ethanoligenens sp.]
MSVGELLNTSGSTDEGGLPSSKFPKSVRRQKHTGWFTDTLVLFLSPAILVLLWEYFSQNGTINPSVLPSPLTIWETFVQMLLSGELAKHLGISLLRVAQGYTIGCVLGIIFGTLMGLVRKFDRVFTLIFGIIRPVPVIAWVPVVILWLGIGETSKISVIALGTFFPVLLNTIQGIQSTDEKYREVAEVLEKSRWSRLNHVIFPCALPSIFTGLRVGLGTAWMSVVGAELIAASSGIGYLISYAGQLSQPDVMLVGVFTIGVIGLLIDVCIKLVQNKVLR